MARNCPGLHRPMLATMTTAARVAWGIMAKSGARKSSVAMTTAAVTTPANWLRAPAPSFTAVCDVSGLAQAVRAIGFGTPLWALADSHRIADVAVLGMTGEVEG